MTMACAQCGSCCNPVIVAPEIPGQCGQRARSQEQPSADDLFITQHWHPVSAFTDESGTWLRMRCDMFDSSSRRCTAYGGRPPVCQGFPWYGDGPVPERAAYLPAPCSFLAEVPPDQRPAGSRPLIPLTPVR